MMFDKPWEFCQPQYITLQGRCYNVYAVAQFAENLPIVEMRIDQMYLSYPSCAEDTFKSFVSHCRSVLEADLNYPIILNELGSVIEGKHRLAKAIIEGRETIQVRRFVVDPAACYTEV